MPIHPYTLQKISKHFFSKNNKIIYKIPLVFVPIDNKSISFNILDIIFNPFD